MGRIYGGAYRGPDGIYHYVYVDDVTGERGEDLSFDPPEMFGPSIAPGAYDWQQPDPWLGVAATGAGLPQNQPIPVGFTAPGATPAEALAGARLNGQPIGPGAPGRVGTWTGVPGRGGTFNYGASLGPYPAGMDPRRNPMSIGANVSEIPYGWGVPGFGQSPIKIRQEYLPYLQQQATGERGGYIPGSGTFNQARLDQPGLIGTVPGQEGTVNLRYGLGGTGDPTTGRELQTPERYVRGTGSATPMQGDEYARGVRPLPTGGGGYGYGSSGDPTASGGGGTGGGADSFFRSTVQSNWGWTAETAGLDHIATLFLRPDTTTGISTAAWSAPPQMWASLADEIRKGRIVVNNPAAWQMLQDKGFTPNTIGGAALTASSPGAGASGTGTGTVGSGFGEGSFQNPDVMNAITSAAQVAYQRTYHQWLATNGDQQLALAQAKQAADEAYRTASLAFQKEQQQQNVGIQASQLMASLRGPANAFSAANALYGLNRTTGVPNAVAALAGEYNVPSFQAPQSLPQAASLQTLSQQLGAAGTGSGADMTTQAQQFAAGLPTPNKVVGRQYAGLSPDTQQLVLAGYESLGYSPEDTLATIKAGLPQFSAPKFGAVA